MLATGGSLAHTCQLLLERGAHRHRSSSSACSPRPRACSCCEDAGLDLQVFTASIDERLNETAFIVPGLGDAGDRQFGSPASG